MQFDELYKMVVNDLVPVIADKKALIQFIGKRSRFEHWFKVEVVDMMLKHGYDAKPEVKKVDVSCPDIAIELKAAPVNYKTEGVESKRVGIKTTRESIITDILKLEELKVKHKYVICLFFPLEHDHKRWKYHYDQLDKLLLRFKYHQFKIDNKFNAVIYVGEV